MAEEICAFLLANCAEERSNSAPKTRYSSFGRLAQERLEFAEELLDWIEIG